MHLNHTTTALLKASALGLAVSIALSATSAAAGPQRRDTGRAVPPASGQVWVASGDVLGDGRSDRSSTRAKRRQQAKPQRTRIEQNGTTVGTASEIRAPDAKPQRAKLEQNGTTVATAGEVQAPSTKPQRTKLKQNGTTVGTASEVQAPVEPGQAALIVPAVQRSHAQPAGSKLEQNGTTVPSASEVAAPRRD